MILFTLNFSKIHIIFLKTMILYRIFKKTDIKSYSFTSDYLNMQYKIITLKNFLISFSNMLGYLKKFDNVKKKLKIRKIIKDTIFIKKSNTLNSFFKKLTYLIF